MTTELIFTLFGAIFASTGFCSLGEKYIQQGWLTRDDYENIYEYLYLPYHDLGGNGSAERIMEEVKRLPLRL